MGMDLCGADGGRDRDWTADNFTRTFGPFFFPLKNVVLRDAAFLFVIIVVNNRNLDWNDHHHTESLRAVKANSHQYRWS